MPKVSDDHLAARRRQILDAALIRFSEQGFHGTPMQAIFDEAGLSPGAVYRYFKSKEEIVYAIASEAIGGAAAAIEPSPDGEPLGPGEILARLLDAVEAIETRRVRLAVQVWGEALHNPPLAEVVTEIVGRLRTRIAGELQAAQRRGALAPGLDPDEVARVLQAVAQGFVIQRSWNDDFDTESFRVAASKLIGDATG